MSFIEMAMDEIKEATVVPEGTYDLRIKRADIKPSKNKPGAINVVVILEIDGEPDAENIFHYISLPNSDDEEKSKNFKALQMKRFLHWFKIPFDSNGFSLEDFAGATARLPLLVDSYEGRTSNKLDLPRIPDER